MKRPAGITVVAILFIALAIISLLWSALVFGVGGLTSLLGGLLGAEGLETFGVSTGLAGFLGLVTATVQFVVAFGLLAMKRWAWILALVGLGLTLLQGLANMFSGGAFALMCGSLGLVIPVLILIYLLTPSVRAIFGMGNQPERPSGAAPASSEPPSADFGSAESSEPESLADDPPDDPDDL